MSSHTDDPLSFSFDLVIPLHTFLGFWSFVLLLYSLSQISKLWLAGSKISNRKRVFFSIISLLVILFLWVALSSVGFSHSFDQLDVTLHDTPHTWSTLIHKVLTEPSFYAALIMRFLYLYPLSLLFRASCWLLLNWFELYQKEKLRKKLPRLLLPGESSEANISPKERRAKAHQRQKH